MPLSVNVTQLQTSLHGVNNETVKMRSHVKRCGAVPRVVAWSRVELCVVLWYGFMLPDGRKPNPITLASSKLAPNMFEAGSCQIPLH